MVIMIGTSGSFLADVSEKGGDKPSFEAKFCFEISELRDIFLRRLEPNIPQAPWTSSTEKHGGQLKIFLFGPKITNQKRIYQKKYAQTTCCKLFFHHRSCRSEASRRKRENSKIWSQRSIACNMWYSLNKGLNRARFSFLCFSHGFNDLICCLSDLLPNGCRKFHENKANSVEKHNHFGIQKCCWDIIYSANL